ncbi:hypothetical protein [Roseibium algae]|uniref:Uncharacterized protein n=1 Tax=Roseibium algae TaxID=3123038 RepID=A0ABU8TSP5_9HYPH
MTFQMSLRRVATCSFALLFTFAPLQLAQAQQVWESRLFLRDQCTISDPPPEIVLPEGEEEFLGTLFGSLAAIFIPKIIDKGVEFTSRAVAKAAADKVSTTEATLAVDGFYQIGKDGRVSPYIKNKCLVFVRGRFGDRGSDAAVSYFTKRNNDNAEIAREFVNDVSLVSEPGIYAEYWISFSPDNSNMRLIPGQFDYNTRLDDRSTDVKDQKRRELIIEVKFETSNGSEAFAVALYPFSNVARPTNRSGASLRGMPSKWLSLPPLSSAAGAQVKAVAAIAAQIETLENTKNQPLFGPDIETIIEGIDGNEKLLEMLGELKEIEDQEKKLFLIRDDAYEKAVLDSSKETATNIDDAKIAAAVRQVNRREKELRSNAELANLHSKRAFIESKFQLARARVDAEAEIFILSEDSKKKFGNNVIEPFNVSLIFRETKEGSQFLKTISEILEESKGELKQALNPEAIAARAQQELQEQHAQESARLIAAQTKLFADILINEYMQLPAETSARERLTKLNEVQNKQQEANYLAESAGLPRPYSQLIAP